MKMYITQPYFNEKSLRYDVDRKRLLTGNYQLLNQSILPKSLRNTMKKIGINDQEKRNLLNKLIRENSVKLAENALLYLAAVNKKYAKYEFTTEFDSNLNLYVGDIISKNFSKLNSTGVYTSELVNYNLTSTDIEYYLSRLKTDAITRIINKIYFEKKDYI
jgi:hypothetical protein